MWPYTKMFSYNTTTAGWDATFQTDLRTWLQSIYHDKTKSNRSINEHQIVIAKPATASDPTVQLLVSAYYRNA